MGASASEALVGHCHPQCIEVCPQVAYDAEMQRAPSRGASMATIGFVDTRVSRRISTKRLAVEEDVGTLAVLHGLFCGTSEDGGPMTRWTTMRTGTTKSLGANDQDAMLRARLSEKWRPGDDLQNGAMRGDLRKVQKALEAKADPSVVNPRGVTPLMLSASSSGRGALAVLKELHSKQSDVQAQDKNGWTALLHACRNGKLEVVKELVLLRADPAAVAKDQKTTLMLTIMDGKIDLVKELLKSNQVKRQVGEKDDLGATALHFSVKAGAMQIARLLLENQAKANAKDVDNRTPLMWACENGQLDCARVLVKKNAEVHTKDKCNRTALLYACLSSYEGAGVWLLKKGADAHAKDISGNSPLSIAHDFGLSELKKFVKLKPRLRTTTSKNRL